ncbi:MAG: hypothetical protein AABZ08_07980 [Planctomycetota bacterium]
MAINTAQSPADTAGTKRFSIGANVVIAIVAAAMLTVALNWIAARKSYRRDVAATGNYGLSDRSKQILNGSKDEILISTLYMPAEDDQKQRDYIQRLEDYCEEMTRFSSSVKVTQAAGPMQREKLVNRISQTFGGEAGKHIEALDTFAKLQTDLKADLEQRMTNGKRLMDTESWLGDFPVFASIVTTLKADRDSLQKAADEIKDLTPKGGIPKYSDATAKVKTALTDVKSHMEAISKRLAELAVLADETTKADSKYTAMLREVASQAKVIVAPLRDAVGSEGQSASSIGSSLKNFADKGTEVGSALETLTERVDQFARAFPMVRQHPNWGTSVQMGPMVSRMEIAEVFQSASQSLAKTRLVILGAIDSKDQAELARALSSAQRSVAVLEQNMGICEKLLSELSTKLFALDPESKALLDGARSGTLFQERIKAIADLDTKIAALPELKLGSVADRLKEENTVVVEAGGKIRVVGFNEVFPIRESVGGGSSKEETSRSFNGDSAISSAILAITSEKPLATAVFVSFEPQPPQQQRNQFTPPPQPSWIPSQQLSEVKKRLEGANFKSLDWNMATTKEEPKGEDGIPKIYVVLPPSPPAQQNPFQQQQQMPQNDFGEPHRETIRKLLDADAKMIFLASWEVRSGGFFGGPPTTPPYGYNPILDKEWGLKVENNRRMVWVEPDRQKSNSFGIIPKNFVHMPAMGFTKHPVGAPMQGTRLLLSDACNVVVKSDAPKDVSIKKVLELPNRENYIGATMTELIHIIDEIQNPNSDGTITLKSPPHHGPYDLMLTAERKDGDKGKGKIVLCTFGAGLRDEFVTQKVMGSGTRLRLEPEPTENLDLFVNAMYWLSGKNEWIARGPVPVPRVLPIEPNEARMMRLVVWGVWPALVFAPGIFLWYVRRR